VGRDRAPDWQDQLQQSLRRAQDAIDRGALQQDEMVKAWTTDLRAAYPDWGSERWQRKLERKLRKRAEREAELLQASLAKGYLWGLCGVALFLAILYDPQMWWLAFPAIFFGSKGARVVARHARLGRGDGDAAGQPGSLGERAASALPGPPLPDGADAQSAARAHRFGALGGAERVPDSARAPSSDGRANGRAGPPGAPAAAPVDPRDARVDAVCDKILAELVDAPEVVRDIFKQPEQTVAALRETCKTLTRRERDVRRFLSPDEDLRLVREREALQQRTDAEADEVTKSRLASALAALDQQREQRAELARSASRFEAEQTRISYTLESLYTQVVRMRSADSASADVAGAGLRRSLDSLSQEVNALADALERVNAQGDAPPVRPSEAQRMSALAEAPGAAAPPAAVAAPLREKA